jgi:hypothetical protein
MYPASCIFFPDSDTDFDPDPETDYRSLFTFFIMYPASINVNFLQVE